MFNSGKFNSFGFNSNTAATTLVVLSAAASFNAGATTDFGEGIIWNQGKVNFNVEANFNPGDPQVISLREAHFNAALRNYFKANLNGAMFGDWTADAVFDPNAVARYAAKLKFETVSDFFADTAFQAAEVHFIAPVPELESLANRGENIEASWDINGVFENEIEPQINGLMVGDWTTSSHLFTDAIADTGLGYLEQDGYLFLEATTEWENIPFLTALFTTGGFLTVGVSWEAEATVETFVDNTFWNVEANFLAPAVTEQVAFVNWETNAHIEGNGLKTAFAISDEWTVSSYLNGHSVVTRNAHWFVDVETEFKGDSWLRLAGVTDWHGLAQIEFNGILWEQANFNWIATGKLDPIKAHYLQEAETHLIVNPVIGLDAVRITFAFMDMEATTSIMKASSILKLVDAPYSRRLYVEEQDRYFEVESKDKDFEVAA